MEGNIEMDKTTGKGKSSKCPKKEEGTMERFNRVIKEKAEAKLKCSEEFANVKPLLFRDEKCELSCGSFYEYMEKNRIDEEQGDFDSVEIQNAEDYNCLVYKELNEIIKNNMDLNWLVVATLYTSRLFEKEEFPNTLNLDEDPRFVFTFDKKKLFSGKASQEDRNILFALRGIKEGELPFKMGPEEMIWLVDELMDVGYCGCFDMQTLMSVTIRTSEATDKIPQQKMLILEFDTENG